MQSHTGGQKLADNRKYARVPSRLRCWCEGENVTLYARIGNLSEGGLFLRTSTPLANGSQATVRFGDSQAVEAAAAVVWSRGVDGGEGPPGMGLKFVNLSDGLKTQIKALVDAEQGAKKGS